jgi:hypothetical protein
MGGRRLPDGAQGARDRADRAAPADHALVVVRDLTGRRRGTGFVADHHGTVVTSHEAVDGPAGLVLESAAGRIREIRTAGAVIPLPGLDLALIRTGDLGAAPLPVTVRARIEPGTYVRLAACGWRAARVLGVTPVTYTTAGGHRHHLGDALELAIGTAGRDALRPGGGAAGGPVLDAGTGAVLGVLCTSLRPGGDRATGLAVRLLAPGPASGPVGTPGTGSDDTPLTALLALLARNAATVPSYGADLNLAGVLAAADARAAAVVGWVGNRAARVERVGGNGADPVTVPGPDRRGGIRGEGRPAPVVLHGGATAESLRVPAAAGHRSADEALADWLQNARLEPGEALRTLFDADADADADADGDGAGAGAGAGDRDRGEDGDGGTARAGAPHGCGRRPRPADPCHRVGPVVRALLLLAERHGAAPSAERLAGLLRGWEADPGSRWAGPVLARVLAGVPDAEPYTGVLRDLADRIVVLRRERRPVPGEFGPWFWTGLRLPYAGRVELLRRLVVADEAPLGGSLNPRHLDAAGRLLAADPVAVQPHLVRWFDDERPLSALPRATVAAAAQALLHTHRHRALDDLVETLADSADRPRAAELLATLAEEEPSAVCRAVARWARDEHPARRTAAVTYGRLAAPHTGTGTDRELLRHAALALLSRPADPAGPGLHSAARALLDQVLTAA